MSSTCRMKFSFLVLVLVFSLKCCKGENETESSTPDLNTKIARSKKTKEALIIEISHRLQTIAEKAILKAKTEKDKQNIIKALKKKLFDTAETKQKTLGINNNTLKRYVDIIFEGLDLTVKKFRRSGSSDVVIAPHINENVKENGTEAMNNITIHSNMKGLRDKLIKDITAKIYKMSSKAMDQINSTEDIHSVMNKLKDKLLSSAKKIQNASNLNPEKWNSYIDVILKSIEFNLNNKLQIANTNLPSRRVYDMKTNDKRQGETTIIYNELTSLSYNKFPQDLELLCEDIEKDICADVKFVVKATCTYDDTELQINKICNGFVDCPDASDEKNCSQQILTYVHRTNNILKSLVSYISHQCLESIEKTEMKSQSKILNDVLNTQAAIIKSHAVLGDSALRYDKDAINIKHTSLTNDVASVIMMTANAVDSVLCKDKQEEKKIIALTRKINEALDENLERTLDKIAQSSPKTCVCLKQNCVKDDCPERCKTVCKNKYFLDRWSCSDDVSSVPLDLVCDGKTDCFDESDEYGCESRSSMSKIENDRTYDDVISLIGLKINSDEYSHVYNKLKVLAESIKKLREATTQPETSLHPPTIKARRNDTYDLIKLIYDESLRELTSDDQINRIHDFLRSIATKLLLTLKNSQTGNTKISSNDLCWCDAARCIMPNCSRPCQRACVMERQLLNHTCSEYKNMTLNLQQMCDGTADCPLRDDEDNCKKDICQRYHLLNLANVLKPMGDDVKSPSLSATIQHWRQEAIEKVKKVEKEVSGRPTRPIFRRLLHQILKDLVMSYAGVMMTKRNNFDIVKKEYSKVANTIRNLYKSCER